MNVLISALFIRKGEDWKQDSKHALEMWYVMYHLGEGKIDESSPQLDRSSWIENETTINGFLMQCCRHKIPFYDTVSDSPIGDGATKARV